MSCFNHPERDHSAVCQQCGKYICVECVGQECPVVLCTICTELKRNEQIADYKELLASNIRKYSIRIILMFLIIYLGAYIGGIVLKDAGKVVMGYAFFAIYCGHTFYQNEFGEMLKSAYLFRHGSAGYLIYLFLRIFSDFVLGFFIAPFYLLWSLFKLARSIHLYRKFIVQTANEE